MLSRRWLKRTIAAVLLCLLIRTVWLVGQREWYRETGNREVAAAVAEIDTADPNWQYEALDANRQRPPQGHNGAELVPRIVALFPGEWARSGLPGNWEPTPPREATLRFPPATISEVNEKLSTLREAVALAGTFKECPTGYRELRLTPDVWSTPLQETVNTRQVLLLLRWETVLAVEEGSTARACDTLLAMLNASRSLGEEPFLISQLIRISTRMIATASLEWVLAQSTPSEEQLLTLSTAWATDAEEPILLHGLRGERAVCDVMFKNLTEGSISGNAITERGKTDITFEGFAWWLYRPRLLADRAYYLRWMTQAIEAAGKPLHEQAAAIQALPSIEEVTHLKIAPLFLPAVEKVAGAHQRGVADMRLRRGGNRLRAVPFEEQAAGPILWPSCHLSSL